MCNNRSSLQLGPQRYKACYIYVIVEFSNAGTRAHAWKAFVEEGKGENKKKNAIVFALFVCLFLFVS